MASFKLAKILSSSVCELGFSLKKKSPEIFLVFGIVGGIVAGVEACKQTTKLEPIIDKAKNDIADIHERHATEDEEKYPEEEYRKDLSKVYLHAGTDIVKLYGPCVALEAASIGCIIASHNTMRKRNLSLAAAYAAVDKSFKEYRKRVAEKFGEDAERKIRYNVKEIEVEENSKDENGNEKKTKRKIEVADENLEDISPYAKFFDESCSAWQKDPEFNLMFLKQKQHYANDLLRARGHLFLNDVYKMLDIPETIAGQTVGWVYNEDNPIGDNYVDFGIYNQKSGAARRFVNGIERNILLDFNVDGNILTSSKISKF